MTVENIKSFREYLEEQKNIENTILEDENGDGKPEAQGKSASLADKYYVGARFTTTPEVKQDPNAVVNKNETDNDKKIDDLKYKSRILMSTLKEMMAMFIGNNDIKTTNSYDVENIRALKMLSTSLKEINDSLDVDNKFRELTKTHKKNEEDHRKDTWLSYKGERDEDRNKSNASKNPTDKASEGTGNEVREEAENSDGLLNERLFGFRVARNDWINAKSKYNADRAADKLEKENKLFDDEKRETFLAKTMKDYEKRASVVINKSANEIMNLIDNADKDINRWIKNRRFITSEDTYIQKISFNLNKAYGLIRYIASSLNTILSDYRSVIYRVSSKMSDAIKKQEERKYSHNENVRKERAERADKFRDDLAAAVKTVTGKTVETSKAATGKMGQLSNLISNNIKNAFSPKELNDKSEEELEDSLNKAVKAKDYKAVNVISGMLNKINKAKEKEKQAKKKEEQARNTGIPGGSDQANKNTKKKPGDAPEAENQAAVGNAVKFAKEFEEDEDEPTNIFDYALKKAKQNN